MQDPLSIFHKTDVFNQQQQVPGNNVACKDGIDLSPELDTL